jgi:hypothetical protein
MKRNFWENTYLNWKYIRIYWRPCHTDLLRWIIVKLFRLSVNKSTIYCDIWIICTLSTQLTDVFHTILVKNTDCFPKRPYVNLNDSHKEDSVLSRVECNFYVQLRKISARKCIISLMLNWRHSYTVNYPKFGWHLHSSVIVLAYVISLCSVFFYC